MNTKSIFISCALAYVLKNTNVHSFQLQCLPKSKRNSPSRRYVGFIREPPDTTPSAKEIEALESVTTLTPFESAWTKYGMIAYILHMCVFLPLFLLPTYFQTKLGTLSKSESEHQSLQVGQRCAKKLLRWIPFMNIEVTPCIIDDPKPSIVVSNHVSMLDTFVFLASDEELRGKNRRPIKTLYWKGLDDNPICKILFSMAGFISVDMTPNGPIPNEYNPASFKQMLKDTKKAIDDGFDVFILPEGQLNPSPEKGLKDGS